MSIYTPYGYVEVDDNIHIEDWQLLTEDDCTLLYELEFDDEEVSTFKYFMELETRVQE